MIGVKCFFFSVAIRGDETAGIEEYVNDDIRMARIADYGHWFF
jgi:hypothetical protein